MKASCFLLVALVLIISVPHPEATRATDLVQITGYVHDVEGRPVEGVSIDAWSLTPPWVLYGCVETDSRGHYVLSFDRPKRLMFPANDFNKCFPVYEGCRINAAGTIRQWMPVTDRFVNTENKSIIEEDFILKPAGAVELKAYDSNSALIETFQTDNSLEDPFWPVYTTDFHWRVVPSQFVDSGVVIMSLDTPSVINFPWTIPGFGRVILRADNGGEGYTLVRQGDTISINLNYELARTECRLLRESYERYLNEGYIISDSVSLDIQSACELLLKADSATGDIQKAHFSDLCLNRTLWTAESLEFEKALQDIEKYRKGNAIVQLLDENGIPMRNVDVSISQVAHDFLFGALLGGSLDLDAHELFREAGMNMVLLQLYWRETEPSLGQHQFPYSLYDMDSLKRMGLCLGAEGLIAFEPSQVWTTGLLSLGFDQFRAKVYQHVHRLVSEYSDYVDHWIVVHNTNTGEGSLGFTREQIAEVIKTGVTAVKAADPTAQILVYMGHICGWEASLHHDEYTLDPYTYLLHLIEDGVDFDGIALQLTYGSVNEWGGPTEKDLYGLQSPYIFRDLASISRILDWYGTLSKPIHITEFNVPGNFRSNLGYWHERTWDEELKTEWIEKFYTIAFSKPLMNEITYWEARDQSYQKANRGLLDPQNSSRESYHALKRLITENWTTRLHMTTDANGQVEFRGFAGDYNITVRAEDLTKNFTIHVFERESKTYRITFDRKEILKEMEAERAKLQIDAQSILQELDRIRQWLETINEVKSAKMLDTINSLMRLYQEGQYAQVVKLGETFIEDPLEIQLNGRLSDFEGFNPILRDPENDVARNSPPGTDITDVYAFADSSYLYIGIRVLGDRPEKNATFTVEIKVDDRMFHVSVVRNGTQCSCFEHPYREGGIWFECAYALGEIVEMQVSLSPLESPETIYLSNLWIWQETAQGPQDFDGYDGPQIKIPNLRSFKPQTKLEIEKTETTYTTATAIGPLIDSSLVYVAIISTFVVLGVFMYWRKTRPRRSGSRVQSND